jgi:hypothetical protein
MGLKQQELADAIHVPFQRVNEIVRCKRGVSTSTALRLNRYFGTSARLRAFIIGNFPIVELLELCILVLSVTVATRRAGRRAAMPAERSQYEKAATGIAERFDPGGWNRA